VLLSYTSMCLHSKRLRGAETGLCAGIRSSPIREDYVGSEDSSTLSGLRGSELTNLLGWPPEMSTPLWGSSLGGLEERAPQKKNTFLFLTRSVLPGSAVPEGAFVKYSWPGSGSAYGYIRQDRRDPQLEGRCRAFAFKQCIREQVERTII